MQRISNNKRKTIIVLSNVSYGLILFRKELLEELAKKYRVIVVASAAGREDEFSAIHCNFINVEIDRHGKNPFADMKLMKAYLKIIYKFKPIAILSYTIKPNIYGGIAGRITKVPVVANVTGLGDAIENKGFLSFLSRTLYRIGISSAYKVFFQNKSNCEFFLSNKLYRGVYEVLPGSGVNLEENCVEEYPTYDEKVGWVISVIGRITRDKGITEILNGAEKFKHKNVIIQLIGDMEGNYREQIEKAEKEGIIRYVGRQDNVHEWIKNSHAVLHASYHEGMSNVLLEAAATGRPVIATDVPGCRETYDDAVSGIGFSAKSTDALVNAVEKFIALPYEAKVDMGMAGRKKMENQFDRRIVVKRYLDTISDIEKGDRTEYVC